MALDKWISGTTPNDTNGTGGAEMAGTVNELIDQDSSGVSSEFTQAADSTLQYYISAGQSLAVGHTNGANAPINTAALTGASLYNGVPAIAPATDTTIGAGDVVSLVNFTQPTRETHIYSLLSGLISSVGGDWLAANMASAGKSILELTIGTDPYNNGLVMRDGALTAAGANAVNIPFATWIQGESDVANDFDAYRAEMSALYTGLQADYSTLNNNKAVPIFTTQIGTSGSFKFGQVELGIANDSAGVFMSGPNWPISRLFPSTTSDYTHLNAQGYIHLGNMLRATIERVVYKSDINYKPLQPVSAVVSGSQVRLDFHVPTGSLEIDVSTFPEAPGLGMEYLFEDSFNEVVQSYTRIGNSIILDFGTFPLITGSRIAGGNTLTDHSTTNGVNVPLINLKGSESKIDAWDDWCCQFEFALTKEMGALDPEIDNVWTYGSPRVDTAATFDTIVGASSLYFLDGLTYQVDYDSADIDAGTVKIWVGDDSHTVVVGGGSYIATRGATSRLRLQSGGAGFFGQVKNIRVTKLT